MDPIRIKAYFDLVADRIEKAAAAGNKDEVIRLCQAVADCMMDQIQRVQRIP